MMRKAAAERCAAKLRPKMGRGAGLLDQLLRLTAEEGSANLGAVLRALYPNAEAEQALARLRQFRLALNRSAQKAGMDFRLVSDTKTRSAPEQRTVWFEGDDLLANEIEKFQ
jgi:hypothetical protein